MKKNQTLLLILMIFGSLAICLLAFTVMTMPGGPLEGRIDLPNLLEKVSMRVSIQTPPQAAVGEEMQMIVIVQNQGKTPLRISEIRLSRELLQVAVIVDVTPGTLFQTHYQESSGFQIDYSLAPGERQDFVFTLVPKTTAEMIVPVQVIAGSTLSETGARLVFAEPIAEVLPTETPTATASLTPTLTPLPPTLTPTPRMEIPYQAIVKITAKVKYTSLLRIVWSGSGTVISPDGLILTNAHLVSGPPGSKVDYFIISLTLEPDQPPVQSFIAEQVYVDKDLDLALLRIATDLRYKEVDPSSLYLTSIPLGNSDLLELGDPLIVLGYPGIGGETITLTAGAVGGFTAQKGYGERAYIKTATVISGGASGGAALDQYGRMVAIPTQLGYGGEDELIDCQLIADTNDDGLINSQDHCVPGGGYINALRPINLALPMIEKFTDIDSITVSVPGTPTSESR